MPRGSHIFLTHTDDASNTLYVYSSFELVPHGNINVDCSYAKKIGKNVSKVCVSDEVIIHEKNIDVCIQKEKELGIEPVLEEPVIIYSDKYKVLDQYDCYLFDQNGCTYLPSESNVYLSEADRIVGYKNGHLKLLVYASPKEKKDTKRLINDILKYHPQSEPFEPNDFMESITDRTILSYLEGCYRSGRINTVIKRYIKEELI